MSGWLRRIFLGAVGLLPVFLAFRSATAQGTPTGPNTPIEHFIVVMQENHTFDNYFGTYPGADGLSQDICVPEDPFDPENGTCVRPFHIGDRALEDLDHTRDTHELQYNEGRMDGFIYALNLKNQDGPLAMAYYDDRELPYYWNLADEYVLFDRFFSSAHAGSVWNHMYWVAGVPGNDHDRIPPGGFGDIPTIFDRLEERQISWKFYIHDYDPAVTFRSLDPDTPLPPQVVWSPLLSYDRFLDDPALFSRIADLSEYFEDLKNGTLPAVAYIVPVGASEHPPGSITVGQRFVRNLIQALMQSEAWYSSALLVTYDDWGGWYDHVPPPQVDDYGFGFRVPAFMVSPYARRGFIDSTELDFTSVLKFIEENWNIEPLAARDAQANNFLTAFDFSQPPREPRFIPWERTPAVQNDPSIQRQAIYGAYGAALAIAGLLLYSTVVRRPFRSDDRPPPEPGRSAPRSEGEAQ